MRSVRVPSIILFTVSAVFAFLLFFLQTSSADALAIGCRTDPIVTLSNGDIVIIDAAIATKPENVKAINYVLHVPPGVTIKNIVYTAGALGIKEKLLLRQDAPKGLYITETVVNTSPLVLVVATSSLRDISISITGFGKQTLIATLRR